MGMSMRIFSYTETFPGKVNFIDHANVLLGYDLGQCCCENASWSIGPNKDGSDAIHKGDNEEPQEIHLENYSFDTDFFEGNEDSYEEEGGSFAIFKIVSYREPDLYVRLENCHNGYYGHGFTFSGKPRIEGCL